VTRTRWIHLLVMGILGVLLTADSVRASRIEPAITVKTDKNRIHVGDPIHLSLEVTAGSDMRIVFPGETLEIQPFFVLDRSHEVESEADGLSREKLHLTISAYEVGDLEIPSLTVTVVSADGSKQDLATEPEFIRVETVLTEEDSAPRDVKGPVSVDASWKYKAAVLAVMFLILVLLVALIWFFRRRRTMSSEKQKSDPPPVPPDVIALKALKQLKAEDLPGKGEIKRFYIELTEIFKSYLGARYGFCAVERTTGEIRIDIQALAMKEFDRHDILEILSVADLVKFAKLVPQSHQHIECFDSVIQFVERTREMVIHERNTGELAVGK
jgi:hypothetical protein